MWPPSNLNLPCTGSSRRHSNESTCSLNVPFERQDTPQVSTISSGYLTKSRSRSLVNIERSGQHSFDVESILNGIEESPKQKLQMRRSSLQNDCKVRLCFPVDLATMFLYFYQALNVHKYGSRIFWSK